MLVLFGGAVIDAHVFGALEAGQEFSHGYVELAAISLVPQRFEREAQGLRVSQVNKSFHSCLHKELL